MILLSSSQIKTYRECVRKWALIKIAGLQTPSTPSQELGKKVDDEQLQPYLRDGRPLDLDKLEGKIAESGLPWLPEPKFKGLEVQKHFVIPSPAGKRLGLDFGYQGYLDLWLPYGGQPGFNDELPVVADFKTTKNIKAPWVLREPTLRTDVQSQLYSVWAMLETKSDALNLSWLYMETGDKRRAEPVQTTVDTAHVSEQFAIIETDATKMAVLRQAAPDGGQQEAIQYALTLEPNMEMCKEYGGCPFRYLCNFSPSQTIFGIDGDLEDKKKEGKTMANKTLDLFAKLGKKKAAEDAPVVEATPAEESALGINPPEKDLPPAPPVGTVEAKPKRGRPPVVKEVAKEAETVAAPEPTSELDVATAALAKAFKDVIVAAKKGA